MFRNRNLLIVTNHAKERVIAPLLEKNLGVSCTVAHNVNTDTLGTFTCEVNRDKDVLAVLRQKCLMGMQQYNTDLAIASEGSFGPHPAMFFAHADDEVVMLLDTRYDIEIVAREISCGTNFNGKFISSRTDLNAFLEQVGFPSHGVVFKDKEDGFTAVEKGITDYYTAYSIFSRFVQDYGGAYLETDMRALYNPTRMRVIEKAVEKLVKKALCSCPVCSSPGFSVTGYRPGLPCGACGFPTKSALVHTATCIKCNYTQETPYPYGKQKEEPQFCDVCNP